MNPGQAKLPILELRGAIQHYAWGSREALARLQGRPVPSPEPEAELWLGDHPGGPAAVRHPDGSEEPLGALVAREPRAVLGDEPHPDPPGLPFLAKLLAAAAPLSIQVHPDAAQAAQGYAREEAAGLAGGERSYRDPNPKRELLVALTPFEALCGFRDDRAVESLVETSGSATARALLEATPPDRPLAAGLFLALQELPEARCRALASELGRFAEQGTGPEATWVGRLLDAHPHDALVAAPLMLNWLRLAPGEGVIVRPGTVHAYLTGFGVEVMTRSDNVVRGGLTPKHVDRVELRRLVDERPAPPERVRAVDGRYETGAEEFGLAVLESGPTATRRRGGRVQVWICIEGAPRVGPLELAPGGAALVPACTEAYDVVGTGRLFCVSG